ncbi:syntaxin, partial [Rhizopus stolonifer]
VEYVRELIRNINKNITNIESIHTSILSSMTYHYSAEINQKLKQRVQHTSHLNKKVRECLKALEMEQTNTHDLQAQLQALKDSFIQSIQRYQDITRKFQNRQKKQLEIQFLIMKPDATIYEVEQAILSDAVPGLFSRSLLNRSKDANKVLEQVYMRHQDIKRIENTIQELYHLFLDMQTMAQTQQPSSLHSEKALEEPSNDLEKGDKHIYVAVQSKETYRKA